MTRVSVDNLGALGMLFDREPHELPPEAWSALRNIRCIDRSIWSSFGHTAIMGVPQVVPYFIIPTLSSTDSILWAYLGLVEAWATDGTTHQEITRGAGDYTGTDAARWNGGNFGGITILNNGVDVPQAWITPALGTLLVNLANWPANTIAKVVRPFGRFLIAMDVTTSGVRRSQLVKWSDETDIGVVPVTWDITDATRKAGEWPLLESEGPCVDGAALGDRFVIYKSDSIHTMTRVAGRFVFAFKQIFGDLSAGILAQDCVKEYKGRHVVATTEDVIIHDGFQYESLLDDKMYRWYLGRVDQANAFRSFIAVNSGENEVWVCMPESGMKFPNVALVINMKDGTQTVQDIPNLSHIASGRPPGASQVYDAFTTPFDQMIGFFGQSTVNAARKRMIGVQPLAERNQLLQSEVLSNAAWTLTQLTIQDNVEGTADGIRPTAVSSQHFETQVYTKLVAEVQTWTLRARASDDGYNFLVLRLDDNGANLAHATFNVSAGTVVGSGVSGTGFTVISAAINGVADAQGYYDCYLTVGTNNGASLRAFIGVNATAVVGLETFVGDAVSRIRVKETQLRRDLLGTYQVTTTVRATGAFFLLDSGFDFDGVAFTARAERTGLSIIGTTRTGEPKSDISMKKLVTDLWPKIQILSGQDVEIFVGMQEGIGRPVLWQGPFSFDPDVSLNISPMLEGRLLAVAFQTSNRESWKADGYDVNVEQLGMF